MADRNSTKDIAIIGMACMFPGAKDVRRYWQNICNRLDAIQEVPAERWRLEDFYCEDRLARDRIYSRWGGFLQPMIFDPVKWRIPPASLPHIEPVQLLSLEVAWQAMVDAGYDPLGGKSQSSSSKSQNSNSKSQSARDSGGDVGLGNRDFPRERAGVLFAVAGPHELGTAYCFRTMMRHYLPKVEELTPQVREQIYASLEEQLPEWTEDSFPGILGNVIAGRIAREFDFHGPNFALDAACASSLAAIFTAVQQLRSGVSDLMLVGGADGTNNPFGYMSFAKTHALSPRGKSRAFDESGDGIALGEGIACIVLKRRDDAERDGDKIHALVKGVGTSSDGKNRSLTAPHPPGQMRAVHRAYEDAEISPATVTLLEAHGTGTVVGDSAELTTLSHVFDAHTSQRQYVAVGSVKSMIGHTKTVAGLASVIKTTLALQNRVLPPTLGVEKPSTRIDLGQSPFYLNTETRPWMDETDGQPRRAGVSSFGFGGTNFHVVLEESTPPSTPDKGRGVDWMPRAAEMFVLQRANRDAMVRDLRQLQQHLDLAATDDLAGLANAVFREEDQRAEPSSTCRLAIVAGSIEELRKKIQKVLALPLNQTELNDPTGIYYSEAAPVQASEVCFLYPGQGSQSVNMLRDLALTCPWSHDLFREANRLLKDDLPQALTRYLYPPPVFQESERARQTAELQDTRIAQPALGLVELFATDLLERFGVRPAFVAGHSYGEHVALHVAGCLSRADLLRLSAQRGRVCAEVSRSCPGAMASVQAGATATETALRELNISAHLANLNAPEQTVIAGPVTAIDAAIEQLSQRGLRARKLPVSAAFHTPQLTDASEGMRTYLAGLSFQRPRLPVYSNTTGQRHADEPDSIRDLLARHFAEPVQFEKEVRQLHADGARVFLEVGPGKVLTDLVSRILNPLTLPSPPEGREDEGTVATLALDVPGRNGWTQLGHLLARLTVLGLPVRLAAWFEGRGLASESIAEFLARTRIENTPKPSDWILLPNKAEPVTPLPARKPTIVARESWIVDRKNTKPDLPSPIPDPRSTIHDSRATIHDSRSEAAMTTANGQANVNGNEIVPAGSDLFAQFQATTRLLLEAQQAQNRVLERYLETQERLLLHCSQGGPAQPTAGVSPPIRPAVVARPPVPIPRTPAVTPSATFVNREARIVDRKDPIHEPRAETPPPARNSSADGEGPPPTEIFRQALLEVVSVRTGYPIDALDETLALEAELGIDSIKTVEIFSNLKVYHRYFRAEDQEEEELLAEFTKLKTLRDIIDSYDRRRQTFVSAARSNGVSVIMGNKVNGVEPANGSLNRYVVTSVSVALGSNGEKKNASLTDDSCS